PPATRPKHAAVAVPVKVITVSLEDVPRFVTGIGSVLSLQSVVIRPQVDGVLTRVLVKEGQQVKAGDLLATLDAIEGALVRDGMVFRYRNDDDHDDGLA
ncbi:secretion protein HlyD, partial [Pseudomonas syringae pv. japonica str. M301072]